MPYSQNGPGWSLTKARTFHECPRRYYYQYHYSKSGSVDESPIDAKLALEMSGIQSMDMWIGETVHQTIEWVLEECKSGNMRTLQESKSHLLSLLSGGWRGSVKQLWRHEKRGVYPNLFEHYYKMRVGKAATDRLKARALISIANFMSSDIFRQITLTSPSNWLPIEKFAAFRLDDILFYVKFDFALKDNEEIIIYDWKTGKQSNEESRQLTCYAMYTSQNWNVPIENIRPKAVHLQPNLLVCPSSADDESVEDMRNYARQSFNAMLKCLRDPKMLIAAMNDFPVTGNLARCPRCNFHGICEQGQMESVHNDGDYAEYIEYE